MLDEAFTSIERYISRSLEAIGVRRCIHKRATSKLFWDQKLSLHKRQRGELWRMAGTHGWQSPKMNFLIQSAKEVDQQLKREVRRRKKMGF